METLKYFSNSNTFMTQSNPFNYNLPAQPLEFVGRERQIGVFENFLENTVSGAPKNMVFHGPRGIGKTSILEKCRSIAEKKGAIVINFSTSIPSPKGRMTAISELCNIILVELHVKLEVLSRLKRIDEKTAKKAQALISEFFQKRRQLGVGVQSDTPFFVDTMVQIWECLSTEANCIVIMIDEAERLEQIPNCLSYLRETFIRIETLKARYMLILSGKMSFTTKASDIASPITRFFHIELLENLNKSEMKDFIKLKLEKSGVFIGEETEDVLYKETEGHPYILVTYLYLLFQNLPEDKKEIDKVHYLACLPQIRRFIAKEFFEKIYARSSKQAKEVLRAIGLYREMEIDFSTIKKVMQKHGNNISPYLGELVSRGAIIRVEHGVYKVFHSLFLNYLTESIPTVNHPRPKIVRTIPKGYIPLDSFLNEHSIS